MVRSTLGRALRFFFSFPIDVFLLTRFFLLFKVDVFCCRECRIGEIRFTLMCPKKRGAPKISRIRNQPDGQVWGDKERERKRERERERQMKWKVHELLKALTNQGDNDASETNSETVHGHEYAQIESQKDPKPPPSEPKPTPHRWVTPLPEEPHTQMWYQRYHPYHPSHAGVCPYMPSFLDPRVAQNNDLGFVAKLWFSIKGLATPSASLRPCRVDTLHCTGKIQCSGHTESASMQTRTRMRPVLGNAKKNHDADAFSVWSGLKACTYMYISRPEKPAGSQNSLVRILIECGKQESFVELWLQQANWDLKTCHLVYNYTYMLTELTKPFAQNYKCT